MFNENVLALVDQGSTLFKNGLSSLFWWLKTQFINNEGSDRSGTVSGSLAQAAVTIYNKFFNMIENFMPGEFINQNFIITQWSDLARLINETGSIEETLKEMFKTNWSKPISALLKIDPIAPTEDFSSWVTRLLKSEATAELASTARDFLNNYKNTVKAPVRQATGSADSLYPLTEPGIRALQDGGSDGFSKLAKRIDIDQVFVHAIDTVLDIFNRVHPDKIIATADSIVMDAKVTQMMPESWYRLTRVVSNYTADTGVNGMILNDTRSVTFKGTSLNGVTPNFAVNLKSKGNLVVSSGMDYFVFVSFRYVNNDGVSVPITVRVIGETTTTFVTNTAQGLFDGDVIKVKCLRSMDGTGHVLSYSVSMTASANIAAGRSTTICWETSIAVCTPIVEQRPDALVSVTDETVQADISASDIWAKYFGTQLVADSTIDPDLCLNGYINNYMIDQIEFKYVIDVLEIMQENGTISMMIVDEDDPKFALAYRGKDGMDEFITDLSNIGLLALLWKGGIFNNAGVQVPKASQIKVFNRINSLLESIKSDFVQGDQDTRDIVYTVVAPRNLV